MRIALYPPIKTIIDKARELKPDATFMDRVFYPVLLPVLIGLGLSPILAFLSVNGLWYFAVVLILMLPAAIIVNKTPFAIIIVWLLLAPFFALTPDTVTRYIFWILQRAMIVSGLLVVILSRLLRVKEYKPFRLGMAELAMGSFAVYLLMSILFLHNGDTAIFIKFYDRMFTPMCMYLLVRLIAPDKKEWQMVIWAALGVVITQSVIGLLSWFAPGVLPRAWLGLQGVRTTGSVGEPSVYTALLGFGIAVLFQAAMNYKNRVARAVFLFAFMLGSLGIFISFSRGSWLGGFIIIFGFLPIYPKQMARMIAALLVFGIILGGSVLASQMAWAGERLDNNKTKYDRIIVYHAAIEMLKAKPAFGWGYENFDRYDHSFYEKVGDAAPGRSDRTSHNTYLTILAEEGFVGFALYFFPSLWWLYLTIRAWSHIPKHGLWSRTLLIALWLAWLNITLVNSFVDMRFSAFGHTLWWLILGFIASIVFQYLPSSSANTSNIISWHQKI